MSNCTGIVNWYVTDYRGTRLVWHFGHWGTGFSAMYLKIPARRLTLVMLANSEALADHHYQVGEDFTHNVFACSFINTFVPEVANERGESDSSVLAPGTPEAPVDAPPAAGGEEDQAAIDHLLGSAVTYRIAVGPQQGRKVFTL